MKDKIKPTRIKAKEEKSPVSFTKDQILASKKYSNRRDILSVLLEDSRDYTTKQVEDCINQFMKRKVE